jgi:hypothetical protein
VTGELEEIRERLGNLEGYVELLESRVDWQERMMRLYEAGIRPTPPSDEKDDARPSVRDAVNTPATRRDSQLEEFGNLLRSILAKQGMHNRELRAAVRGQEHLQSSLKNIAASLNSAGETLRHIDRNVRALVTKPDAD